MKIEFLYDYYGGNQTFYILNLFHIYLVFTDNHSGE